MARWRWRPVDIPLWDPDPRSMIALQRLLFAVEPAVETTALRYLRTIGQVFDFICDEVSNHERAETESAHPQRRDDSMQMRLPFQPFAENNERPDGSGMIAGARAMVGKQ